MIMKRSETNVCFGPLSMRYQNDLKNMTKYGITKQVKATQKKTSPGEIPGERFPSTYILNVIHIWMTKVLQKSSDRKEQWSEYK